MAQTRRSRPSQRDVAQRAGVSRTTVSFVINEVEGAGIPEATRERVWAAVRELGFRPNQLARNLRAATSNVIGLVTNEIATTPYAVGIVKGAQDAAHEHGRTLLIIDAESEADATREALATVARWQVEHLLFATDYHRQVTLPTVDAETELVLVNCFGDDGIPAIVPDECQGGRLATETLLRAGHRRIGFINGPDGYPASRSRLAGHLEALEAAGVHRDEQLLRVGDWWQEGGTRHAADLLDLDDPPTALFCANDWTAMGAYDAARERGRRIPDDVAVIGFDNRVEIAAHMRPKLTTVALPYAEMGRRAVEHLLGVRPVTSVERVHCPLVERASV